MSIVTIDGPSGGGKSTISRLLAGRLGFTFLDTGAMYRAVAFRAQEQGIDPDAADAGRRLAALLADFPLRFLPPAGPGDDVGVAIGGRDISGLLRTPAMGPLASRFSALPVVREHMVRLQRAIGVQGNLVAEGRDMGTVVFPQADYKFFLDASPEERARRRVLQLGERKITADYDEILAQIKKRDDDDRSRAHSPLAAAADAVLIDASRLSIDEVLAAMLTRIHSGD